MTEKSYAVIKNEEVKNVILFDNPSEELLNLFKQELDADLIIEANEKSSIGGTYDGSKFWLPKPYPSWIQNQETNEWVAPIPYPVIEEGSDEIYTWDENTTSWLLLPPSN